MNLDYEIGFVDKSEKGKELRFSAFMTFRSVDANYPILRAEGS